jgi:hypothetical protein
MGIFCLFHPLYSRCIAGIIKKKKIGSKCQVPKQQWGLDYSTKPSGTVLCLMCNNIMAV